MIPQIILMTVAGLATIISRLMKSGDDVKAQEEALKDGAELFKRALDYYKFGAPNVPVPDDIPTAPKL